MMFCDNHADIKLKWSSVNNPKLNKQFSLTLSKLCGFDGKLTAQKEVQCIMYVNASFYCKAMWWELQSVPTLMYIVIFVHHFVALLNCGECLIKVLHMIWFWMALHGAEINFESWLIILIGIIIDDQQPFDQYTPWKRWITQPVFLYRQIDDLIESISNRRRTDK